MEMAIWNAILTAFLGLLGWSLRDKADEIKRLQILINKTREEMPKEYVTKVDLHADINRIMDRLDRLETKIDMFMKEQRSALS